MEEAKSQKKVTKTIKKPIQSEKATSTINAPFDRYAIIQTGGKQYQAIEGKTIAVELLEGNVGDSIEFSEVLLRKSSPGNIEVGTPFLASGVKASIVKHMRGPKIIVFKFKRRKKSRVKKGHRQPMTVVRIDAI